MPEKSLNLVFFKRKQCNYYVMSLNPVFTEFGPNTFLHTSSIWRDQCENMKFVVQAIFFDRRVHFRISVFEILKVD